MKQSRKKLKKPAADGAQRANVTVLRRCLALLCFCGIFLFALLVPQLYKLMITEHDDYERMAINNQTRSTAVSASRGTIYDRNFNALAISASVNNVFISPNEIAQKEQDVDRIADGLAELLDVDADKIREMAQDKKMYYKVVKRKIDQTQSEQVRDFINTYDLKGVYLEPDTKRYYPASTLAAQVLGFVNVDNAGVEGLEFVYDSDLQGTAGKIVTTKGNGGSEMLYRFETYYEASDGDSLVTTIDSTVQYFLEKNMEQAIAQYDVQNGAFGLVMDVNTGAILAMATLGSYDPNNYGEIYDEQVRAELAEKKAALASLSGEAYDEAYQNYLSEVNAALLKQWRNRCVSDAYEPGSTFKIISLASALEEGVVTLDSSFYCGGNIKVFGRNKPIDCWKAVGHGTQTTAEALGNSCNCAFATIGIALGGERFYDYVKAFGLTAKTGIDMPGESAGVMLNKSYLTEYDVYGYSSLAVAAFGQTFEITPLQLVRAISAVVNGGYLLQPYVVQEIVDANGQTVTQHETKAVRQVISKETSDIMRELILGVVETGTAKNAKIAGYAIGGKTGTSEKVSEIDEFGNMTEDKIVSFVGIFPMDDPQYICLVALDTPSRETGLYISGGQMAAPTVRNVLADILPYLGVEPDYSGEDAAAMDVTVPYVTGKSQMEAQTALAEANLNYRVVGSGESVTGQIPAGGATIPGGSAVVLYCDADVPTDFVTVPSLTGLSAVEVNNQLTNLGLYLKLIGNTGTDYSIIATHQSIAAGTQVERGTVVEVEFTDTSLME